MKLAIYQTSDLHGYVNPSNYIEHRDLGILKIASFILEDEKKYDYSLKIDCGDLIQGSPMTYYLSKNNFERNPIVSLLNDVGFDFFVIGNHEFNYGLDYLYNSYREVEGKILNSNIDGLDLNTKPFSIVSYGGFRVAIVGASTKFIPNWEKSETIEKISFMDPVEEFAKYESYIVNHSDMIIYAYHGGFEKALDGSGAITEKQTGENQASQLIETYDTIDLVLSGHQHRSFIEKINGVVCSQPMNNGMSFAKFVVDTETGVISYELIDTQGIKTPINESLSSRFTQLNKEIELYLDRQIGHFERNILLDDLFMARLEGHPFINFLHQVQLSVSGADFSSVCLFDSAIGFKENVTIRDVLINYPYPNTLKVLELTGYKIKEAVEKSATYFEIDDKGNIVISEEFLKPKLQNYNYDMYYGFDYEVDLNLPKGNRVVSITINGVDLELEKKYTIVLNNYRATNTSIYPAYEGAVLIKDINTDVSELIIDFFNAHGNVKVNCKRNYKFLK